MVLAAIKARLELMTVNDMRELQEEEKKNKDIFFLILLLFLNALLWKNKEPKGKEGGRERWKGLTRRKIGFKG